MNTRMNMSTNFNGREPEVLTFSALLTLLGRPSRRETSRCIIRMRAMESLPMRSGKRVTQEQMAFAAPQVDQASP